MLRAVDAALVVTDERIRRLLGTSVQLAAPRLGCVTASSLGGFNSIEIGATADAVALIQFSSGTTQDPNPSRLPMRICCRTLPRLSVISPRMAPRTRWASPGCRSTTTWG